MADPDPAETQRTKELRLLVLQYLHEEGYKEAAHELEQESGLYFDAKHLEELVQCGAWDDAERYLVGFTNWNENIYSAKIFFATRYQKYLESHYRLLACEEGQVVADDLEALAPFNEFWANRAAAFEEIREGETARAWAQRQPGMLLPLKTMMRQSLEQKYSLGNKPELVRDWTLFSDLPCDTSCNGARSGTKEQTTGACRTQNVKQTHKQPLMVKTTKLARGMPDSATTCSKVVGLLYTSNGNVLLALHSNAVHNLWKWQRGCKNKSWQPANEIVLKNDTSDVNPEEATPCIALSQTKFCVMSASGGKISMFNIMTFQIFHTFMAPPPATTFIAFHPRDINIIALGMEDSTIQIYNLNVEQWGPKGALPAPISSAVYSCDCLLIYAGFCDGAIGVFEAESLRLLSWMAPPYIPPSIPSVGRVYPIVVAAHPSVPNQIGIGMNDGSVYVLE
ncbi:unnamed protein product [Urochloa decumbens]|uniref:CTLH domain-containing protein n=1 Tax=Urochloa decumbens TaxID=240449 RepID=A0ABC9BZL2_9POAL